MALLTGGPNRLPAFKYEIHNDVITAAFRQAPRAAQVADLDSARSANRNMDLLENDDEKQFQHAMRSRRSRTPEAKLATEQFIQLEMHQALAAARRGDPARAGRHLGRMLHAAQDKKHRWCSCGPGSNPEAADPCSSHPNGCAVEGSGNHNLRDDCGLPLDYLLKPCKSKNFQQCTDAYPLPAQIDQATKESVALLEQFVRQL
ncbi:MAG: hypothetical protein HYR60_33880 [Acidobacteria bacterium]|nr:hypothetical protein [Acidobacteriota bacterium]